MLNKTFHLWLSYGLALAAAVPPAIAQTTPDLKGSKITIVDFGGALQKALREEWPELGGKDVEIKYWLDWDKYHDEVIPGDGGYSVARAVTP